jgi:hypothetical protein
MRLDVPNLGPSAQETARGLFLCGSRGRAAGVVAGNNAGVSNAAEMQRIQAFLAERDYLCRCGYNLRGLSGGRCPECARRIWVPADPGEEEAARRAEVVEFLKDRDLFCKHCKHNMRGASSNQCPGCGASYMLAGGRVASPQLTARRLSRDSGRRMRSKLLIVALGGWLLLTVLLLRMATSIDTSTRGVILAAILLALLPTAVLGGWGLATPWIRRLSGRERSLLSLAALLLAGGSVVLGMWLLAGAR